MKKFYIKTYGCQMNVYDSQQMENLLHPHGYTPIETADDADIVILNTCHIREKAADRMYSELGRIRKLKSKRQEQGDNMIITVAGCVGQAEGEEIFRRAPYVDIVVGPQSYTTLPDLISKIKRDNTNLINLDFTEEGKFDQLPANENHQSATTFLSVQEGCDKFCTFCVVPYTRGAEFSRPVHKIYREALSLVARGAIELQLLGQNVNAFHGADEDGNIWNLGKLITHLSQIKGLERIRYTTSHPRDMHPELYDAHKIDKVMPYVHLPVQSGSDKILAKMNRKHRRDEYFKIIDKLRDIRPDVAFSSDFIVGFPGETEQDFEDTMDLVRRVKYAQCYSFKYSPRPGTPGANMEDHVPEDIKTERLVRLQALLNEQQLEFNQQMLGMTLPVLFDHHGKFENQLIGRTPYMQALRLDNAGDIKVGDLVNMKVTGAFANSLLGEVA